MYEKLDRIFKLKQNNTNIRTEVSAGITTFLAMAYILAVNPAILSSAGMDRGGIMIATALAAFAGTMLMAFLANYPFALAPSMGLNAYFAFTVVQGMGCSWQLALFAVFFEGIIFLIMSLTNIREMIFNTIPLPLKKAAGVGIGFFIAFIALQNSHLVTAHSVTLVTFQTIRGEAWHTVGVAAILTVAGVLITTGLLHKKIKSAILMGIVITWVMGMICEVTKLYYVIPEQGFNALIPELGSNSFGKAFSGFKDICGGAFDVKNWTIKGSAVSGWKLIFSSQFISVVLAFLFVDLFSAIGTLTGVASQAGMLQADGKLPRINGAFAADSLATSIGAALGTSTTTTYVESAAGVVEGGRTGLAAVVTAILFLFSIFLAPLLLAVPAFVVAPALIIVGFYMISSIVEFDFKDIGEAIPVYLTIIVMPFSYSITDGISMGIISWTLINLMLNRRERVSWLMFVLTLIFLANYFWLK